MARQMKAFGLFDGPVADLLPPEFDADLVSDFFSRGKAKASEHDANGPEDTAVSDLHLPHTELPGQAAPAPYDYDFSNSDGDAKPAFAGGGGGGNGGGGGGKGKKGGGSTADPGSTDTGSESTDTGSTDTGSTDTGSGSTDTGPDTGSTTAADYVSGQDTPDGFNVELMFSGTWTNTFKEAAYAAAETISDIIIGDLPSYNGIDDVRITLTMGSIDGSGGTWGRGGTDTLRSGSLLSAEGHVTIDAADAGTASSYGILDDLLLHEMLHALGFGTNWSSLGLVSNYNGDLRFNGAYATTVYNTEFAAIAGTDSLSDKGVPIETEGGSGSAGKHWDETTFDTEIMSTQLDYQNTLTNLTIAALQDMGYQTILQGELLLV